MSVVEPIDWNFQTQRVHARLIDQCDRDLYRDLYTSSEVMAHIAPVMSVTGADATFEQALRHSHDPEARARYWRIDDAGSGVAAGIAALVLRARSNLHGELGIMLLPHAQRRGLGLCAVAGVVEGVIAQRWWPTLECMIFRHAAANPRAGGIAARLGFQREPGDGSGSVEWRLDRSIWYSARDQWPAL